MRDAGRRPAGLSRPRPASAWAFAAAGLAGALGILWPGSVIAWLALGVAGLLLPVFCPPAALVLLALTAPFEQARDFFGITLYTTEALLLLAGPGIGWSLRRRVLRRRALRATLALWPFLVVVLLSAVHAQAAHAWKGALRWAELLAVLVWSATGLRRGQDAAAVLWTLVAAAALSAGQGWAQTLAGPAAHPELTAIALAGRDVTRAAAGYGANTLAMLLALVLPFAWAAARSHPRAGARAGAAVLAAWLLLGAVPTFSLAGALALAVAAVLVGLGPGVQPAARRRFAAVAAGLLAVGLWIALLPQVRGFWETKLASISDRLDYLRVAVRLWQTSPWLGVGPGLYRFLAPALGPGVNPVGLVTHPHSLYLSVLAELGALGLITFLAALGLAGRDLAVRARRLPTGWARDGAWALVAGLAGFAAANLLEHGLIHDRGAHAALLLGAAWAWVRRPPRLRRPEPRAVFDRVWRAESLPADRAGAEALLAERARARAPLYELLAAGLAGRADARILELGCGPALDALNLAGRPGREICALDVSPTALERARRMAALTGRTLVVLAADARATGLPSATFDLVFSQGLLEHFPDPGPVWSEMARLLKPGGRAVVDVPQTLNPYTLAKAWHRWRGDWPWGWETQYTPGRLRREGRAAGLSPIGARGYGYRGGPLDATAVLRRWVQPLAPRAWQGFERRTGAWWMMNVVMLFEKMDPRAAGRPERAA